MYGDRITILKPESLAKEMIKNEYGKYLIEILEEEGNEKNADEVY